MEGFEIQESSPPSSSPARTRGSTSRKSSRWSAAMDTILGITEEEGHQLSMLEMDMHQAAGKASVRALRQDCLRDPVLRTWDLLAWVLTVVFAVCLAAGPMFAEVLIEVVTNGGDGEVSIEKALAWEVVYLLFTAFVAAGRKMACGHVVRRIIYRLDIGLANLSVLASDGRCPVSVAHEAREVRSDRVSRTAAKMSIEAPIDILLYGTLGVLCLISVSLLSWKVGLVLLLIVIVAAIIGCVELRFSTVHSEIERRLATFAEQEGLVSGFGGTPESSFTKDNEAPRHWTRTTQPCFDAAASHGTTTNLVAEARDFLHLEGVLSTLRSVLRLVQMLLVGNAVLLLMYVGALNVMRDRSNHRPEQLLESLLTSIVAVYSFAMLQGRATSTTNALPQVRVVARLQQEYFVINQQLVTSLRKRDMSLKGLSFGRIACGVFVITIIIAGWLWFLLSVGGGFACQPVPASCVAVPTTRVGPLALEIPQTFSLSFGGCIFDKEERLILEDCFGQIRQMEAGFEIDSADDELAEAISKETHLSCMDDVEGPVAVLNEEGRKAGEIIGAEGRQMLCNELSAILSADSWDRVTKNGCQPTDEEVNQFHEKGYMIKTEDPVPEELLSSGADTSLTVRIEYNDWTGAPAFFETSLDKDGVLLDQRRMLEATGVEAKAATLDGNGDFRIRGAGTPMMFASRSRAIRRQRRARVMRGQISGRSPKQYAAKLLVTVTVSDRRHAGSDDTLSMQLFVGAPCSSRSSGPCELEATTPVFVLGKDWQNGEERSVRVSVPTKLPKIALACSSEQPENCLASADVITSGRDGFLGTFSIAILEDGDGRTRQDPDKKVYFELQSFLKCEGSERRGTLNCLADVDASVPEVPIAPTAGEAARPRPSSGHNDKECVPHTETRCSIEAYDPVPAVSAASDLNKANAVELVHYNFDPDPNTGGHAAWTIWISKATRSAVRFAYRVTADCGCYKRIHTFKVDRNYRAVQQTTGSAYPKYCLAPTRNWKPWNLNGLKMDQVKRQCSDHLLYDRGHLVAANHLDHHKEAIVQSNLMVNILPQVAIMNRQAWLATEEIVECVRDTVPLMVTGGAVFDETLLKSGTMGFNGKGLGKGSSKVSWRGDLDMKGRRKWFWATHKVETPTYMWKVIQATEKGRIPGAIHDVIAFWMPNTEESTRANLGKFVISVDQLEKLLQLHGRVTRDLHVKEKFDKMSDAEKAHIADLKVWRGYVNGHCIQ